MGGLSRPETLHTYRAHLPLATVSSPSIRQLCNVSTTKKKNISDPSDKASNEHRCTFCTGYVYLAILVILPERFQIVNGENALLSGIHLLPLLGATAFGAFSAGAVSRKRNNTSWTLMVAHVFQLVGIGLMSTLKDATTETKAQYGFQVLLGLGFGLSLGGGTLMASLQSRSEDLAVAQGAIAQARVFGGAIGIAICSIIFNRQVTTELANKMVPGDMAALHRSPTIVSWLPESTRLLVRSV